jgi:hypothetical protein
MPKGITDKVIVRLHSILEFIENEICVTTKQVMRVFGLTHSQAFYVLQQLRNRGLIEEHVVGKLSVWCLAGHVLNDVHIGDVLISIADLERAICKILENAKGHKATIKISWVADKIAETINVNPRLPRLLNYLADMLPIMLSNVKKSIFRDAKNIEFYVVDTCSICAHFSECPACETLRKKLNCLD